MARADGPEVIDDLDSLAPPSDVPAPSPEAQPEPTDAAPPADPSPETLEPVAPVTDPDPVPASPLPTFVAPTGEPFTFRVDRNVIPLEGAVLTPDKGVYFPAEVWRKVESNYLGDRRGWGRERQALEARAQEVEQAKGQREIHAETLLATMNELFDPKNREDLLAKLEDWDRQAPILRAQAEARAVTQERDRLAEQMQQREDAEEESRLVPQMQHWVASGVERALETGGPLAGLMDRDEASRFVRELWDNHLPALFQKGPSREQRVLVQRDALEDRIQARAELIQRYRGTQERVKKVEATNAAALAPTKPGLAAPAKPAPKVEKARDDAGKFVKQDADEWEKDFMKTQFHKQI